MLGAEVAQNRVRFPQNKAVIVDHWDHSVRIFFAEFVGRGDAKMQPCVDALVRYTQFSASPHDLLDVGRILSTPEFQHDVYLSVRSQRIARRSG